MLPLACMPTIHGTIGTIEARQRPTWTTPVRYWTVQSRSGQNRIGGRERSAPSCQGFGRYSAWKASCSDLFVVGQPLKETRVRSVFPKMQMIQAAAQSAFLGREVPA